jgi:hypothetical protein
MGLRLFPGSAGRGVVVEDEARRSRFGTYCPRVFAYVPPRTGDEGKPANSGRSVRARVLTVPDVKRTSSAWRCSPPPKCVIASADWRPRA